MSDLGWAAIISLLLCFGVPVVALMVIWFGFLCAKVWSYGAAKGRKLFEDEERKKRNG